MRGSPVRRAIVAFLVLLSLAPILVKVTAARVQTAVPIDSGATAKKVQLALAFTSKPERIAVVHLGREVWKKEAPEAEEEIGLEIPWPEQGGELVFRVGWPEGAPLAAMRARLTDSRDVEIERSLWSAGPVEAVLNFP
ncbi:MAG: hypothetical protein RL088_4066 [Verrucomicrobiota bacterium]|jgi:hypothetical protein